MFINTPLGKIFIWTYHKLIEDIFDEERRSAGDKYDSVERLTLDGLNKKAYDRESGNPKNILNDIIDVAYLNFFLAGEETADVYLDHEGFYFYYNDSVNNDRLTYYSYDDFIKFHHLKETFVFSDDYE